MKPYTMSILVVTFILFGLLAISSFAAESSDDMTYDEMQVTCLLEGGCAFVTKQWLDSALRAAMEQGRKRGIEEGRKSCLKGLT